MMSRNILNHVYRENLAAASAASECGTAQLGRIVMLINDDLCPDPQSLRNAQKFAKSRQVVETQRNDGWRKSVGPSY